MATLLRFIPYVEQFSFRRVLTSALCSLASLPFQYEEASLSHGALQASNPSLACLRTKEFAQGRSVAMFFISRREK